MMVFVLYRETEVLLSHNDDLTTITELEEVFTSLESARAYVQQYEGQALAWGPFAPNIVALRPRPLPSWGACSHLPDVQGWVIEERPVQSHHRPAPLERIA